MRRAFASFFKFAVEDTRLCLKAMLLSLVLLVGTAGQLRAEEVQVGVFDLMPFGGQDESGALQGIIPDVWAILLRDSGIEAEITAIPYKRMFHQLSQGTTDTAIFFRTPQSAAIARAVTPVYTLRNVVVGRRGNNLTTYEDMYGQTIGVARGTFYEERFDKDQGLNKTPIPGFLHAVKLLLSDRLDLVAGPEVSFAWHLDQLGHDQTSLGKSWFLGTRSAWLQVPHSGGRLSDKQVLDLVSRIEAMREDGTIDRIMNRYRWVSQ